MISFIIINFNTFRLTIRAVESIYASCDAGLHFEIIIVDNSEKDTELQELRYLLETHENIFIYTDSNRGFGAANNFGIKQSHGDIVFLLNSDAEIVSLISGDIVDVFNNDNSIGVLAPKVLNVDGSVQPSLSRFSCIHISLFRFLKLGSFIRNHKSIFYIFKFVSFLVPTITYYFTREENADKLREVEWASGCALIIRKDVYALLNGFDENIFMYFEDEELCYRITKLGYKIKYHPGIVIKHGCGGSNNAKVNNIIEISKIDSELYYYRKCYPKKYKRLILIYKLISAFLSPINKRMNMIRRHL
jgi:GT2 family glycosyltransferase